MFWFVENYCDFHGIEVYDDTDNTFVKVDLVKDIDFLRNLAYNNKFGGEFYIGYTRYYYVIPKFVFINPNKLDEYKSSNMKSVLAGLSETYFPINKFTKEKGVWGVFDSEEYVTALNIKSGEMFTFNFELSGKTIFISDKFVPMSFPIGVSYIEELDKEYRSIYLDSKLLYLNNKWRYVVRTANHYIYFDALNIFDKSNIIVVPVDNYVREREIKSSVRNSVPLDYRRMRRNGGSVDLTTINYNSLVKNFGDFETRKNKYESDRLAVLEKYKIAVTEESEPVKDYNFIKEVEPSIEIDKQVKKCELVNEVKKVKEIKPQINEDVKSIIAGFISIIIWVFLAPFVITIVGSSYSENCDILKAYSDVFSIWNKCLFTRFVISYSSISIIFKSLCLFKNYRQNKKC